MRTSAASSTKRKRGPGRLYRAGSSFLLMLLFLAFASIANAAQVTLSWDANAEPELSGYKVYYGTETKNYALYYDVGNATTLTIPDLQVGQTYYIAATAYDASGLESDFSNEVSFAPLGDCSYSITPGSQSFGPTGGTGSMVVTTQANCAWTANGASWVTVTSGASGAGSGTVMYAVSANTSTSSRMLATNIANQSFTVVQEGATSNTITASAGAGGSISPSGSTSVASGMSQSYTITPTNGFKVSSVTVDGSSVGAVTSYTFNNVTANHAIAATFAPVTYSVAVTKTGTGTGTVTASPSTTGLPADTLVTLTATPASGSTFAGWSGACSGTSTTCQVTVDGNTSVGASFVRATLYTISASAGRNGSISPAGRIKVTSGNSRTFVMTPKAGYRVAYLVIDGQRVSTSETTYTFDAVAKNHSIKAMFAR